MTINKFVLDATQAVLVVVDVQERLSAAMEPGALAQVTRNIGLLLEGAQELALPVLFTEQYVKGLGPTLAELKEKAPDAPRYEKLSFSCCGNESFNEALKKTGRGQVILCGMEAHVCVLQTGLDLLATGYDVHLVKDAVISRSVENKQTGIEAMVLAGAVPSSTETAVFQLLKVAGTDSFKKLSRLVK